ncbi:FtsX-like permease family protein [Ammoniphilus sp. CFH 90114]|uniref:FtsX-like permease family protein n=1 Tax=Ammoniphilus sp. CFH 90114 TaxID=2493665 RepID=UPI00100F45DC|nr:ABC transporter permease [Ammoniphilus sp. CFH 90114]RXT06576.1 ABC transporter permease [Ammoniphilus sp. CFH 90114]
MNIKQLILRSLKINIKHYYVYVFALIFSVALYFSFVNLQYDPALDEVKGSIKGAASLRAASILLVAIVLIFMMYANNLFIKRRGKEIGLLQLIGMTKSRIFQILSTENSILYFGSLSIGIFLGFCITRLVKLILFKITRVAAEATLDFSTQALVQTLVVFTAIFLLITFSNYIYIKKQNILSLFRMMSTTEGKRIRAALSGAEISIGVLGLVLISAGYLVSSQLFGGKFTATNELFLAMVFILASVIIGTYLFYKGSVSFIFHLIRKRKDGYLNVNEVLSLSTIMFRMKSNALLLTIITTVSALAIGLLSLSYISYYSAEKSAKNHVAADFSMTKPQDAERFKDALTSQNIPYQENMIEVVRVKANLEHILSTNLEGLNFDPKRFVISVISDTSVQNIDLKAQETVFTGASDLIDKFFSLKESGSVELEGHQEFIALDYLGLRKDYLLSMYFTDGGLPIAIVDDATFKKLKRDLDPEIQKESSQHIGIVIMEEDQLEKANTIFTKMTETKESPSYSRIEMSNQQKRNMGLIMFIVGFLGLTFLLTSGCILYFKQMSESEEERNSFTILRKLGFTQGDLIKGIQAKQGFNFGIPLIMGLLHSYFAVQSGWFLFGADLWIPMIVVMILYATLYSLFGLLSVQHYKQVIKEAL